MSTATASAQSISLNAVTRVYKTRQGTVLAVDRASLAVGGGEFVSLVGPSGCGKSTLLKLVAGLDSCDGGSIEVAGAPPKAGRREAGIMLQAPVLLPWRTVRENVMLPAEIFKLRGDEVRARADGLLERVGLGGFEDSYSWELSGGMQQRASLARLLVLEPSILLLDEPFAALDELTREQLLEALLDIHERLGRTTLYVTHNIGESVLLSDRVAVMSARPGRFVEVVDIGLPRPRRVSMLEEAEGVRLMAEIRHLLRGDHDD